MCYFKELCTEVRDIVQETGIKTFPKKKKCKKAKRLSEEALLIAVKRKEAKSKGVLLGRKAIINLDSILKTKDITVSTKVHIVKAMVFVGKVIFLLFNIHTYIHKTIKK